MRTFAVLAIICCSLLSAAVVANSKETGAERTVDLTYSFTVSDIPSDATSVKAWIPYPVESDVQHVHSYMVDQTYPVELVTADDFGNSFLSFDLTGASGDVTIDVVYRVTRMAYRADDDAGVGFDHALLRYLEPNKLVPVDGVVAEEAAAVAGDMDDAFKAAKALFTNIVSTVEYDKSGEGWGRGDATFACDVRAGNCTDFHSLFIGEARSLGIPARFLMGIPLPPERGEGEIGGYHCWAEFFAMGNGWVPIDASETRKHPEKKDEFFAGLDENRIQFTMGRDIVVPGTSVDTHSFFIYPYVEVDGSKWDSVSKAFSYRDV